MLLNDTASARLAGAASDIITGPARVEGVLAEPGGGYGEFRGLHDGYQQRYGMTHTRVLRLSPHGDKLTGADRIFHGQKLALARGQGDLTYSIHFHIHPQARVRYGAESGVALITLPDGEVWTFNAFGSKLSLEDSLHFASFSGPARTMQIVLRGHVLADTQIAWSLESGTPPPMPHLADHS